MFGHPEGPHAVLASRAITRKGKTVVLERRKETAPIHLLNALQAPNLSPAQRANLEQKLSHYAKARDYLTLTSEGTPAILKYTRGSESAPDVSPEEASARMQQDWETLIANPDTPLHELRWCQLVEHDTGHLSQRVLRYITSLS